MVGLFSNQQKCIDELKNQCFKFYTALNGVIYYYSPAKKEIAELVEHKDGSYSVLIGRFSN